MRSPVGPEEPEEVPALTQNDEQVRDRLKEGAYCITHLVEDGGEVYSPCSGGTGGGGWSAVNRLALQFAVLRVPSIPNSRWRSVG